MDETETVLESITEAQMRGTPMTYTQLVSELSGKMPEDRIRSVLLRLYDSAKVMNRNVRMDGKDVRVIVNPNKPLSS